MRDLKKISVEEFFDNASSASLLAEYADECALVGMPKPNPNIETYKMLEGSGIFSMYASFDGLEMTGFMVLLLSQNPHYSAPIGTIESIFTAKKHRSGGDGLNLINKARDIAKSGGAIGLFISAPASGVFSKVMSGLGAKHTNNVFFWGL